VTQGSHAAADGSFGRSAGIQVGRAILLVGVAVLIGLVLLRHNAGPGGSTAVASATSTTKPPPPTTTVAPSTSSTVAARPAQNVKVLVANGSGISGLAGTVSTRLKGQGYDTLAVTNASHVAASVVYFQPTYTAEGAALAQALSLPASSVQPMPNPPPVSSVGAANIVVVAGPDVSQGGGTTTSSTTTTTKSSPSTTKSGSTGSTTSTTRPHGTTPST
jgi:hypothetical protein